MTIAITTLIGLILLNAFFAASEMALVALNDNKIKRMAEDGDKKQKCCIILFPNQAAF